MWAAAVVALAGPAAAADGEAVFASACAACHQPKGQGIPGAFPAPAGSAFVQGPPADPAGVVLKGRGGMPAFSNDLSDADIAAVVSYVRQAWGNKAPAVSEAEVSALRSAGPSEDPGKSLQAH